MQQCYFGLADNLGAAQTYSQGRRRDKRFRFPLTPHAASDYKGAARIGRDTMRRP